MVPRFATARELSRDVSSVVEIGGNSGPAAESTGDDEFAGNLDEAGRGGNVAAVAAGVGGNRGSVGGGSAGGARETFHARARIVGEGEEMRRSRQGRFEDPEKQLLLSQRASVTRRSMNGSMNGSINGSLNGFLKDE